MENNYYISINTSAENRTIYVANAYIDEAIAFAINIFDKYAHHINDRVLVSQATKTAPYLKSVRQIVRKEYNKVEFTVL